MKWRSVFAMLLVLLAITVVLHAPASAQQDPEKAKIDLFLNLLGDKSVQEWLQSQKVQDAGSQTEAGESPRAAIGSEVAIRLDAIRNHLGDLALAIPRIPSKFKDASARLRQGSNGYGGLAVIALVLGFTGLGLVAERLYRRAIARFRISVANSEPSSPRERLVRMLLRLVLSIGSILVFIVASIGCFVAFSWPQMLHEIVVILLTASAITFIAYQVLDLLLSPHEAQSRILQMADDAALHWRNRLLLATGWYAAGYAIIDTLRRLGVDRAESQIVAYLLGIGLLAIGLNAVWRQPGVLKPDSNKAEEPELAAPAESTRWHWLYSAGFIGIWFLWVIGAKAAFWLLVAMLCLPVLVRHSRNAVYKFFAAGEVSVGKAAPSVLAALVERGLRAILIIGVLLALAHSLNIELTRLAADNDPLLRFARNLVIVLLILLVIDLVWQVMRTMIDMTLERAREQGEIGTPEAIRRAKLRTLLPVFRNAAFIFLIVLAILMSLSTLGVQIGPLIASAGVIGVAIGFGAQTLVKDVISGMFYLLDDAFRIGEYIIAGEFRGVVESFSLRSVRLRHHRGPVFTVPFGQLGAIQNMSRDYVIDKFTLTVTYGSDIEKARKLLKEVGKELAADPELAHEIIEPLKMQSIGDFGDYGIQIKVKMKCQPGGQYMVRKKAYPLIKQKFDENGIEFAYPTIRIAEEDADEDSHVKAAAARHAIAISAAQGKTG